MSFVETLHYSPTREHIVGAVRRMIVHALNIAGRKSQNPGLEILPPEQVHPSLSFLSAFGHFKNFQDLHSDLLLVMVMRCANLAPTLFPRERTCQGARCPFVTPPVSNPYSDR